MLVSDEVEIPVQVLGKLKGVVTLPRTATQQDAEAAVMSSQIASNFEGKNIVKVIYVPGKIINFIVK